MINAAYEVMNHLGHLFFPGSIYNLKSDHGTIVFSAEFMTNVMFVF